MKIPLLPPRGYISSRPRQEVPIDAMTGPSLDWLVGHRRLRRRSGSQVFGDTLTAAGAEVAGVLESKWGARARRIISATLRSAADGFPAPLMLYANETSKRATLAFRSTNGTDSWRTFGKEFSSTHYPDAGVPTHRVVPMVYEQEDGSQVLHRLNTVDARAHFAGGSRDVLQVRGQVVVPGYTATPCQLNGRYNDAAGSGTEAFECMPLGMIPPLQMPTASAGTDLGGTPGPWQGKYGWFFTVLFENEAGELSMYAVPRPPGSAWTGYGGFGYIQVSSANPTHYFSGIAYANIPDGPPGTRYKWLCRTSAVDVTAGQVPNLATLAQVVRLPQGITAYVDTNGNDSSLNADPRIADISTGGLQWAPRARYIGRFDGHSTLGHLRPNPSALIIAPWANGSANLPIDDDALYTGDRYFVAVDQTNLTLRKVSGGSTTKTGRIVSGSTIIGLTDTTGVMVGAGVSGTHVASGSTVTSLSPLVDVACVATAGSDSLEVTDSSLCRIGQGVAELIGGHLPATPSVIAIIDATHVRLNGNCAASATITCLFAQATLSLPATGTATGETFTFSAAATDRTIALAGLTLQDIVDRINADASESTSSIYAAYVAGNNKIVLGGVVGVGLPAIDPTTIPFGATIISSDFPSGTVAIGTTTWLGSPALVVSNNATSPSAAGDYITVVTRSGGTDIQWGAGVAPGADRFEQADNLMLTRATVIADYDTAFARFELNTVADAAYITPGMGVYGTGWTAGTTVLAVDTATGYVTTSAHPTSTAIGIRMYVAFDTGDTASGIDAGFVRTFGNCFPCVMYWGKEYLDRFEPDRQDTMFTAATPGYAQDGVNTWLYRNHRGAPTGFGAFMGFADVGPLEVHFYARARMLLYNPRTGLTHADEDYAKITSSWTRGCRSPYAICAGNGWVIYLSDEGLFAVSVQPGMVGGEVLISRDLYDVGRPVGQRGSLEYAIKACIAASESDTDGYALHANVVGGVLYVNYWSSATAGYPDRQVRYDFSEGSGRTGLQEVLRADGTPYPWSAPLSLRVSCSAKMAQADGSEHHFAAMDSNAGTADGRVQEIDTGTEDDGVQVQPVGYTGLYMDEALDELQPNRAYVLSTAIGDGLTVAITMQPEVSPEDAKWDVLDIDAPEADAFGRAVSWLEPYQSLRRAAFALRIAHDGSGDVPEVSALVLEGEVVRSTTTTKMRKA